MPMSSVPSKLCKIFRSYSCNTITKPVCIFCLIQVSHKVLYRATYTKALD